MNKAGWFSASAWSMGVLVFAAASGACASAPPKATSAQPPRQMEELDRGLVAIQRSDGVFLSWRWLGTESDKVGFDIYRDGHKINSQRLYTGNYLDTGGTAGSVYQLSASSGPGEPQPTGDGATAHVQSGDYYAIPIQPPAGGTTPDGVAYTYSANDASVGDLDGDGRYEIIVKWDPSNSKDNSQSGYTGNVYIDAYELDGTRLWRIDLGRNIRAGAHYTQFMVYDFDGDGYAEVAMKTADGTVDGQGTVIGDGTADYRTEYGYILDGPEFLSIFNGMDGHVMDTVDYDPPRGTVCDWGDCYGNRVDRFLAAVAYLDGQKPSLVMARGYYTRTVLASYDWDGHHLQERWRFDTNDDGNSDYAGQGNHNLSVADVDGDGRDEITYGAMAIDDDGTGLYNTGLGHGDAMHLGDLDPNHPGLEVFDVHEDKSAAYGIEFRDAASGETLWGVYTGKDTGRGMSADVDPRYPGEEFWAAGGFGMFDTQGNVVSTVIPRSTNFGIWWDGDLLREQLDHAWNSSLGVGVGRIDKWDYVNATDVNLLTATGTYSNNYTKGTPNLQADLWGDWREEAIWRSEDSSELRVYTSSIETPYRLRTLMHDPEYRLAIAWQNVGYNQPPHPSFYLGDGMTMPPAPNIRLVQPQHKHPGGMHH